jgi:hypothetical protein
VVDIIFTYEYNNGDAINDVICYPIWSLIENCTIKMNNSQVFSTKDGELQHHWIDHLLTRHHEEEDLRLELYDQYEATDAFTANKITPITVTNGTASKVKSKWSQVQDFMRRYNLSDLVTMEFDFELVSSGSAINKRLEYAGTSGALQSNFSIDNMKMYWVVERGINPLPRAAPYTLAIKKFEEKIFRQTNNLLTTANTKMEIELHVHFSTLNNIRRLIIWGQDDTAIDSYQRRLSGFVGQMRLILGGSEVRMEERHLNEKEIFAQENKYYVLQWGHRSLITPIVPATKANQWTFMSLDEVYEKNTSDESLLVSGRSNQSNLVLELTSNAAPLPAGSSLHILAEHDELLEQVGGKFRRLN